MQQPLTWTWAITPSDWTMICPKYAPLYFCGESTPTYDYQWALHVLQTSSKLRCQSWWLRVPSSVHWQSLVHHKGWPGWSSLKAETSTHQAQMHRTEGKCSEMLLLCRRNRISWFCVDQRRHQATTKQGKGYRRADTATECQAVT